MALSDVPAAFVVAVGRREPTGVHLLGSAFAVGEKFYATTHHVTGGDPSNLVLVLSNPPLVSLNSYQDTSNTDVLLVEASITAVDPLRDVEILEVDAAVRVPRPVSGADEAPPGAPVVTLGFPHADHGRMVLTRQDTHVGARVLIESGGIKAKYLILNIQTRPGQSGSPVLSTRNEVVAMVVGSYAPGGGGGVIIGGIDPQTLHQTTHAVSAEYIKQMLQ